MTYDTGRGGISSVGLNALSRLHINILLRSRHLVVSGIPVSSSHGVSAALVFSKPLEEGSGIVEAVVIVIDGFPVPLDVAFHGADTIL